MSEPATPTKPISARPARGAAAKEGALVRRLVAAWTGPAQPARDARNIDNGIRSAVRVAGADQEPQWDGTLSYLGVTFEGVPHIAQERCDHVCCKGRNRMHSSILSEIDAEIARLQSVKALLSSAKSDAAVRRDGRPAPKAATSTPTKKVKRRKLSAEARERMRQAQVRRWAAFKKSARANLNATVSPIPVAKKKAAKAAVK